MSSSPRSPLDDSSQSHMLSDWRPLTGPPGAERRAGESWQDAFDVTRSWHRRVSSVERDRAYLSDMADAARIALSHVAGIDREQFVAAPLGLHALPALAGRKPSHAGG